MHRITNLCANIYRNFKFFPNFTWNRVGHFGPLILHAHTHILYDIHHYAHTHTQDRPLGSWAWEADDLNRLQPHRCQVQLHQQLSWGAQVHPLLPRHQHCLWGVQVYLVLDLVSITVVYLVWLNIITVCGYDWRWSTVWCIYRYEHWCAPIMGKIMHQKDQGAWGRGLKRRVLFELVYKNWNIDPQYYVTR